MFSKEFYPTPENVMHMMEIGCLNKVCYEPHGGKGDLVNYLNANGAKNVLTSELNDDLRGILERNAGCRVVGSDFFSVTAEMISHVDIIVMNPPFSNAEKHIEHAYEIAPEGCEIISLCNWETIEKESRYRSLNALLRDYGIKKNLGNVFKDAERSTYYTEIGLVKLFKPILSDSYNFEGFFIEPDEEEAQEEGLIKFNEVRALVQGYVSAMECFDELDAVLERIQQRTSRVGLGKLSLGLSYNESITTKAEFSKCLQKKSWKYVFDKMNMNKYVTQGVKKTINSFVEEQEKYPFTMRNVYHMMDMIFQTRNNIMDNSLIEIMEKFTKHTHQNRFGVEGWKTNEGHMLNRKFIIDYIAVPSESGKVEIQYPSYESSAANKLNDLTRVLCNLTGLNYDEIPDIYDFRDMDFDEKRYKGTKKLSTNKWYDWGFFEFKVYKKGTMHLHFKSVDDWFLLNQRYGALKGFDLPEKLKQK